MSNVYFLGKLGFDVIDLTDMPQVMVHGSDNYSKAVTMLKTMNVTDVKEYFCPNCGNYKPDKQECKCMEN